jgi:ubiquinone biosynthesis protein UbiJ
MVTRATSTSTMQPSHAAPHSGDASHFDQQRAAQQSHDAIEALRHEVAALRTRVEQLESTVSQLQSLLT